MRINGEWLLFDDGVVRPVIRGEILTGGGSWQPAEFLVDTGADRTVSENFKIDVALIVQGRFSDGR